MEFLEFAPCIAYDHDHKPLVHLESEKACPGSDERQRIQTTAIHHEKDLQRILPWKCVGKDRFDPRQIHPDKAEKVERGESRQSVQD